MEQVGYMTPDEVAIKFREAGMKTSTQRIRAGIEQGIYPFGVCIYMGKNREFEIYPALVDKYIEERLKNNQV